MTPTCPGKYFAVIKLRLVVYYGMPRSYRMDSTGNKQCSKSTPTCSGKCFAFTVACLASCKRQLEISQIG